MADWDQDGPELEANLKRVLEEIRDAARRREPPSVEAARRWQTETLRNLDVPDPLYVGAFRGEPGLEHIQVHVNGRFGVPAPEVAAALGDFERQLRAVIARLDELIPPGAELDADQTDAILEVCAWAHTQWVCIHPFANGNGRTARLWVNSIAMRYGLPPFLRLRPRPAGGYGRASAQAMHGDWEPTIIVLRQALAEFGRQWPEDH